jgi:hypothetical protein
MKKKKCKKNNTNTHTIAFYSDRARHFDSGYFFLLLFLLSHISSALFFSQHKPYKKGQPARQHIRREHEKKKVTERREKSRKNKKKNPFMALPSDILFKMFPFCTFAVVANAFSIYPVY